MEEEQLSIDSNIVDYDVTVDDNIVGDDEDETSLELKQRRESETRLKRRHYKKDSRFLLDLYTLTFDEDQVSTLSLCPTKIK